jgi:NADPH2:quinone reductase
VIDVEFGAHLSADIDILRTSGTLVAYGSAHLPEPVMPFYRMMFQDLLIRLVIVYEMPEFAKEAAIRDINDALGQDRLQHRISRVDGLSHIVQSHELVEQAGFRGCVVLDI